MGNYTGAKCISCGEIFKDGDDVVVCPDCGTPYHRECYLKEGRCINDALHESGQSWTQETEEIPEEEKAEGVRCIRCGFENTPDKLFCEKCGTPLMKMGSDPAPFNTVGGEAKNQDQFRYGSENGAAQNGRIVFDQNSEIDGVKLGDYAKYVGSNPISFLSNFIRFGKFGGKISLNIGAFIFPEVYFLYRKMNAWGIMSMLVFALLSIPSMIYYFGSGEYGITLNMDIDLKSRQFLLIYNAATYVTLLVKILAGLFANYIYYKQAKKDITGIRDDSLGSDDAETSRRIADKGGVSWAGVIIGFTAYSVISIGSVMLMGRLM